MGKTVQEKPKKRPVAAAASKLKLPGKKKKEAPAPKKKKVVTIVEPKEKKERTPKKAPRTFRVLNDKKFLNYFKALIKSLGGHKVSDEVKGVVNVLIQELAEGFCNRIFTSCHDIQTIKTRHVSNGVAQETLIRRNGRVNLLPRIHEVAQKMEETFDAAYPKAVKSEK